MMKIKVKKEMRLDELIKWARSNPELSKGKNFLQQVTAMASFVFKRTQMSVRHQSVCHLMLLSKSKWKRKSQKKR